MKKKFYLLLLISYFLAICSACSPNNGGQKEVGATPTLSTLQGDRGGITGVYQTNEQLGTDQLIAFAAPYLGDPSSDGIFVYGENMEFAAQIDSSGFFQITNLSPGLYILLIGSNINQAKAYQSNGKAIKIEVLPGEYTDVGIIN